MTEVAGKAVYITGGSSGMGFAVGKKLAALGAHIAVFDRSGGGDALPQIEAARRAPEHRVAAYTLNVADRDAALATVKRAVTKFGAPDIVIHMAGIGGAGELASWRAGEHALRDVRPHHAGQRLRHAPCGRGGAAGDAGTRQRR